MGVAVTEIAPEIYRISTFHPELGIQFNQFLANALKDYVKYYRSTSWDRVNFFERFCELRALTKLEETFS